MTIIIRKSSSLSAKNSQTSPIFSYLLRSFQFECIGWWFICHGKSIDIMHELRRISFKMSPTLSNPLSQKPFPPASKHPTCQARMRCSTCQCFTTSDATEIIGTSWTSALKAKPFSGKRSVPTPEPLAFQAFRDFETKKNGKTADGKVVHSMAKPRNVHLKSHGSKFSNHLGQRIKSSLTPGFPILSPEAVQMHQFSHARIAAKATLPSVPSCARKQGCETQHHPGCLWEPHVPPHLPMISFFKVRKHEKSQHSQPTMVLPASLVLHTAVFWQRFAQGCGFPPELTLFMRP